MHWERASWLLKIARHRSDIKLGLTIHILLPAALYLSVARLSDWTTFCENDLAASAFPLYVDDWALQESKWRNRPLQSSQDIRISGYPTTRKLEGQSKDYWAEGDDTVPQSWDRGSKFIAVSIVHHLLLLDLLYLHDDHICELWKRTSVICPKHWSVIFACPVPILHASDWKPNHDKTHCVVLVWYYSVLLSSYVDMAIQSKYMTE